MQKKILQIGIVGAGSFASFAAHAFLRVEGVKIVAVADVNETAAQHMGAELNAEVYVNFETFLNDINIDLVYIATPPFLHYLHSKQALLAGKHVICEKPAALHVSEAEELTVLATSLSLLYVVNLMQRYNPLYSIVKSIVNEKLLGNFLHGFFENYASDENLYPDHWFWDESKSGGIFIEHGVHFFDMFSGWLGEGKIVSALQLQRPYNGKKIVDRVQATVLYQGGTVNFYHGFDQPKILDRQEMRLQFERGEITLYEWVPVKMKLHGLLLNEQLQILSELLVNFKMVHHNKPFLQSQTAKARFNDVIFDDHITLEYEDVLRKQNRYQEMLMAMITDQWTWIKDQAHIRIVDHNNAVQSLKMAGEANRIAQNIQS